MTMSDRELGMDRSITRRDFLNGVSLAIGATVARPTRADALEFTQTGSAPAQASDYYPPALTGLRGSHPGSYEVAHAMRDGKQWTPEDTGETYDLVVVGGGLSGLAAAYYFRKAVGPEAKILILDNHDDFGGHAKRNEFKHGDRTVIGYGGTMYIVAWNTYSLEGRMLFQDIGLDPTRFYKATDPDKDLYQRLGLQRAVFFDKETFGTDRLVVGEPLITPAMSGATGGTASTGSSELTWAQFLAKCPLSDTVKSDIQNLYEYKRDCMPELSKAEKIQRLRKISYREYLLDQVKLHADTWKYFQARQLGGPNSGGAPDSFSAWSSFRLGFPGFDGLGIGERPPRTFVAKPAEMIHFPDGNAGIARLIMRWLIPSALPGSTMEDAVTSRLDYSKLDGPSSPTRVRLNSTVVRAKHNGEPGSAKDVEITYVRDGKAYRVAANACVMACYNAVIPYLCPEMPAQQKEALHMAVRKPFVYTNVFIRNWTSFSKLGVSSIHAPGGYHDGVGLDFPVSLGKYRCAKAPEEPIVLHMQRVPLGSGKTARDQFRTGREDLLATSFETFERKIRDELGRMLVEGGFDPARDIEGITVNRWPHGYASGQNSLYDPDWSDEALPWIVGRRRWGRIAIANSDAAAICLTQAAFEQAHRAVGEIVTDVMRPQFMYPWSEKM